MSEQKLALHYIKVVSVDCYQFPKIKLNIFLFCDHFEILKWKKSKKKTGRHPGMSEEEKRINVTLDIE